MVIWILSLRCRSTPGIVLHLISNSWWISVLLPSQIFKKTNLQQKTHTLLFGSCQRDGKIEGVHSLSIGSWVYGKMAEKRDPVNILESSIENFNFRRQSQRDPSVDVCGIQHHLRLLYFKWPSEVGSFYFPCGSMLKAFMCASLSGWPWSCVSVFQEHSCQRALATLKTIYWRKVIKLSKEGFRGVVSCKSIS